MCRRRLRGKTCVIKPSKFRRTRLRLIGKQKPLYRIYTECRTRVSGINTRRRLLGKQKLPQQLTEDRTETELSKNDGIWPELEKIDELLELDTGGLFASRLTTRRTTESK